MTMEKKGAKRGEEKRRKKRTKRGLLKEDVRVFVLWKSLKIFSQGRDLVSCGDLSWEDLLDKTEDQSDRESEARVDVSVVPDVLDVLVSPSSVVTEFCGGFSCCSGWDFVEPQSISFSQKRAHSCTVVQKEMWSEEPEVTAPPVSKRRMMPPTPLQNSHASFE